MIDGGNCSGIETGHGSISAVFVSKACHAFNTIGILHGVFYLKSLPSYSNLVNPLSVKRAIEAIM